MTTLRSFDVFDTVLMRAVTHPQSIFLLLGRQLLADGVVQCSPEAFAAARRAAEVRAYRTALANGEQVRLRAIHDELGTALQLDAGTRDRVHDAELALEARLLRPVPDGVARVAAARRAGERVAFVSDTPWPAEFLSAQLARFDVLRGDDLVLASSETGLNKDDGGIYAALLSAGGVRAEQVVHRGNHRRHDVEAAAELGLRAEHAPAANPSPLERLLESSADRTHGGAALLAGAAREARLRVAVTDARQASLRNLAAAVAAPLLVPYVLWLLRRAQELRIDTLWFLARDGQVMLELAQVLATKLGIGIELRYLLASRQAWNLPAYACGAHRDLAWIFDHSDGLTARALLARVGLSPEDLPRLLAGAGISAAAVDDPLHGDALRALGDGLAQPGARRRIAAAAAARLECWSTHLRTEGVLDDDRRHAIVELVGHGNLQESLTAAMRHCGARPPEAFYYSWIEDGRERAMRTPHRFTERVPGFAVIALEAFCAADHGTLLGYERGAEDAVTPLCAAPNQPVVDWGLPLLRRTLVAFAKALPADEDLLAPDAALHAIALETLHELWLYPSAEQAAVLGEFPWEDGHGEHTRHLLLAPPYGWRALWPALREGALRRPHRAAWHPGSLRRTPPARAWCLRAAARIGRAFRP